MPNANTLPIIADRFLNTPLLIDPSKAEVIFGVLQGRIVTGDVDLQTGTDTPQPDATRFVGTNRGAEGGYKLSRRSGSVAIIDVIGSLVNRGAWIGANSGLISYEGIGAQIDQIMADAKAGEVTSVILDINSPGGEATGMFGVSEKVRALAAVVPVIAVVNDVAASAAYGIASGATEIVVSPTSFVGSIGVVLVHMDHSGELEQKGIRATIIHAGANKVDGHPFGPLSKDVQAGMQSRVDTLYDKFLETVEAGRGDRLDADHARATEANIYIGQDAIDLGVADRVGTFDAILAELKQQTPRGDQTETITMSDQPNAPEAVGTAKTYTQAQHDAAVTQAKADGATEATTRIGAILTSDAAKGREAMAQTLALETDLSADAAGKILESSPVSVAIASSADALANLEARSAEGEEMGAADAGKQQPAADSGWGDVVAAINKRVE